MVVTAVVAAVCVTLGTAAALAIRLDGGGHAPRFTYADLDAATYQFHNDALDGGDYAHQLSSPELARLRRQLATWHIEPRTDGLGGLMVGTVASIVLDFHGRAHTYSLGDDAQFCDLRGDVNHLATYLNATLQSKLQRVDLNSGSSPAG